MEQLHEYERAFQNRSNKAKHDLIGAIWYSEISTLLDFNKVSSAEEEILLKQVITELGSELGMKLGEVESRDVYENIMTFDQRRI